MNCGLCKKEARLVDLGREMGPPYFFCGECKLEQKEWEERVAPKTEATGHGVQRRKSHTELLNEALTVGNMLYPPTPPSKASPRGHKTTKIVDDPATVGGLVFKVESGTYGDCPYCGALSGVDCNPGCFNA